LALKHDRSLIPLAQQVRKPVVRLTPIDGAIGSHAVAVKEAYSDFRSRAEVILNRMHAGRRLVSTRVGSPASEPL
jgi:hypothetical protein